MLTISVCGGLYWSPPTKGTSIWALRLHAKHANIDPIEDMMILRWEYAGDAKGRGWHPILYMKGAPKKLRDSLTTRELCPICTACSWQLT